MSRRPFDPAELNGEGTDVRDVAGRLETYVRDTASVEAPGRLPERVMAAIPERGSGGLFGAFGGALRALRAAPLALMLLLLVGFGGALAAGQLTGVLQLLPVTTPAPIVRPTESAAASPVESAVPTTSPSPSVSPTPGPTESPVASPVATDTPDPSPEESATPGALP